MPQRETRPFDPALPLIPCQTVAPDWPSQAPERFDNVAVLPLPAARLFEVFEDPDAWSRWGTGISNVEWTSPRPFGTGTTRTVRFWGGIKVYEEFSVFEPPHRMAFSFYGTTELIWTHFMEVYEVHDLGDGRCRLEWTVAYEPAGGFARAHPWIRPLMRWNLRSYMWRLARYCRRLPPVLEQAAPVR